MLDRILVGKDNWLVEFKSKKSDCHRKTWIVCSLSNGKDIYLLSDYKISLIKEYCYLNNVYITSIGLRYRSHEIKLDEQSDEGYYIVKSLRGSMSGDTKNCIVLGILKDGKVHKKAYLTPELIVLYEDVDDIEKCFEEAIIYNDKKANKKKQL